MVFVSRKYGLIKDWILPMPVWTQWQKRIMLSSADIQAPVLYSMLTYYINDYLSWNMQYCA
jgi:hypothetical protein